MTDRLRIVVITALLLIGFVALATGTLLLREHMVTYRAEQAATVEVLPTAEETR